MTTLDLRERGFVRYGTLPKAYTFCPPCGRYRWFGWYQAPEPDRLQVAACDSCGSLTPFEACVAAKCPIVCELPVLVEKR